MIKNVKLNVNVNENISDFYNIMPALKQKYLFDIEIIENY